MQKLFKTKNFTGKNKKIIEIVTSEIHYKLLEENGNDNLKIYLPLELYIGKLDSLNNFARTELKKYISLNNYLPFQNDFSFKKEFEKAKRYIENADKIRIWSSHLDCDDYCRLLFLCFYFENKNISVIFAEEYEWYTTTYSMMTKEELKEIEKKEHILKKYQKEQYKNEWKEIVLNNKELRFMINGKVYSVDIDYFDEEILKRIKKKDKIEMYSLIADLIGNPIIPFIYYSDYVYKYLINRLVLNNLIKQEIVNNKKYLYLNK